MRHKEKIIKFWTDRYLHLGATVTSRVEGAHWVLKEYLESPSIDLLELHLKYEKLLEKHHKELTTLMGAEKLRTYPSFRGPEFNQLRKTVSVHALDIVLSQIKRYKHLVNSGIPLDRCTQSVRNSLGLPCLHEIAELGVNSEIPLEFVHPFWMYNTNEINIHTERNREFYLLLDKLRAAYESSPSTNQELRTNELRNVSQRIMEILRAPTEDDTNIF